MLTTALFILLLTIKPGLTALLEVIDDSLEHFRSDSDDSFRQFDNETILSEHTVEIPIPLDTEDNIEFHNLTALTVESLSRLSLTQFPNPVSSSTKSCLNELLHIKRSSSLKSLGFSSDDESTINWYGPKSKSIPKVSSFCLPAPISEAPTETVSTATVTTYSSVPTMPNSFKQVFEKPSLSDSILSFLNTKDLRNLLLCSRNLNRILNSHETESFNELFPSLIGISESLFGLQILKGILQDENMKFDDWSLRTVHLHSDPVINLSSFITFRTENSRLPNERYALANLIEFLRLTGWHEYFDTLPSPLKIFFNHESSVSLDEFKEKIIPFVMKAAHYGHLRLLKALANNIIRTFLPSSWPQIILDVFLLGTEKRNGISWTALHRSIHAPDSQMTNYLLYVLAGNEEVLEAFQKNLRSKNCPLTSELPSTFEKFIFPATSRQKVKRLLQKRMLLAIAANKVRALHLAIMKSSNPDILNLFLVLERELIETPAERKEMSVPLQLAFKYKSIHALNFIKRYVNLEDVPIEYAITSDWSLGLKEYNNIHEMITRHYGIFHLIAKHGSVEILKFLQTEILSPAEFINLSEQADDNFKKPVDIALENGKWDTLIFLAKNNPKQINNKLYMRILEVNASILDNFITDQYELECFAGSSVSKTNHVTYFEWSILSGNQQAFRWFLQKLPRSFLRRFDGAGNTPIHLAVIVGNSEALIRLLEIDPRLLKVQNFLRETPIRLAYRIRDKTFTCNKIFLIDNILQILVEETDKV